MTNSRPVVRDDAEVRLQRRERIVGDLRLGRRDAREEGRLAGVGQADEADIGDQLQPQPDPRLLARRGPGWRGAGARLVDDLEMRVAEAAVAALGETHRACRAR